MKHWNGLGSINWKVNLRNINGLFWVAGVLGATIVMASASEVKYQRLANEMSKVTIIEQPAHIKLAQCSLASPADQIAIR